MSSLVRLCVLSLFFFPPRDSMFDMPDSMMRMSNGGQHVGSDSANASTRTVQATAANAVSSKVCSDAIHSFCFFLSFFLSPLSLLVDNIHMYIVEYFRALF